MQNRKTRILIGIMVGLVLFSSSVALLLYMKQKKSEKVVQKSIEVFVAAKNIQKGEAINATSLRKARLPQSYISFTPLTDTEIIGRFANVNIYKGEPIRPEKIVASKPQPKTKVAHPTSKKAQIVVKQTPQKPQQLTQDTLSVSLSLFRNQDISLHSNDFIDIACSIPSARKQNLFQTKYVALHVKINNFISNGVTSKKLLTHNDKNQIIKADSVILEMSPKEIKNFLSYYYKTQQLNNQRVYNLHHYSGQLWMIKTPKKIDPKIQKQKERLLVDKKISHIQRKRQAQRVKISYEK